MKYPWYTPYQFAGNTPIMATDMDGSEPKEVITNEQVTKPIIGFLMGAFDISEKTSRNTSWEANTVWMAITQHNSPGATEITLGYKVHYLASEAAKNTAADIPYWVSTVAHEHTHRKQIDKLGMYSFYTDYLEQNKKVGYWNISYEKEAYKVGGNSGVPGATDVFFSNSNNVNEFNAILFDTKTSDAVKMYKMEILGVDKIALPRLYKEQQDAVKQFYSKGSDPSSFEAKELSRIQNEIWDKENRKVELYKKIDEENK